MDDLGVPPFMETSIWEYGILNDIDNFSYGSENGDSMKMGNGE